jgi:proline iminopeptidase
MIIRVAAVLVGLLHVAASVAVANAAPIAATHATFPAQGSMLSYTAYGTGPNVVVLAGGPGLNAAYMAPLAREIAADGYRAVLLDQRGTGASTAAGHDRALLTQAGTVADIDALRVALHEQRLRFVTHSFGGGMALAYAAAHPTRVANLVLIG